MVNFGEKGASLVRTAWHIACIGIPGIYFRSLYRIWHAFDYVIMVNQVGMVFNFLVLLLTVLYVLVVSLLKTVLLKIPYC